MVKIVSTHVIVGDQRTPEMYGWFSSNPDMDQPNQIPDTNGAAMRRNARRRKERAEARQARALEKYLAKFSGEERGGDG